MCLAANSELTFHVSGHRTMQGTTTGDHDFWFFRGAVLYKKAAVADTNTHSRTAQCALEPNVVAGLPCYNTPT